MIVTWLKWRERFGRSLPNRAASRGHRHHASVSIGISVYPEDGDDVETLVKNADLAMYAAKEKREEYRFFTEAMNRRALNRMRLENGLRTALQNRQLVVHYQPLVEENHRIIGMEALLQWRHPDLGQVSPATFIPIAEEIGAIIPIGKWVMHTACQQAKKWHEMGHTGFNVAVNLSPPTAPRSRSDGDDRASVGGCWSAAGMPYPGSDRRWHHGKSGASCRHNDLCFATRGAAFRSMTLGPATLR